MVFKSKTGVLLAAASVVALLCAGGPALAQNADASESAMVNLIRLLVAKGTLSRADGDALLHQARDEAAQARAAHRRERRSGVVEAAAPASAETPAQPALPNAAVAAAAPPAEGTVRVPYVPEVVRNQIRDEVKAEVLAEARAENWAQPNTLPDWIRRLEWGGDIRFRDQSAFYGSGNVREFIDFAAFNDQGPIDIASAFPPVPFLNTTEDRTNQLSIRARLYLKAQVADGVTVGVRLASGNSNGPVSTTQLLGGGWSKKDFWLDQAYITIAPAKWTSITFGRMADPFFHTELVYDDDLNFDGIAWDARGKIARGLSVWTTAGAFPIGYVSDSFPSLSADKGANHTKWLFGGQIGVDIGLARNSSWKTSVAYYDFYNVQGQISAPCTLTNGNRACSSDETRMPFMQKGNTLFNLRNLFPDPMDPTNFPQNQFVGLANDFNLLNITTELDLRVGDTYDLALSADYVRNLEYRKHLPPEGSLGTNVNNCPVNPPGDVHCHGLVSGPNGWQGKITFGHLIPTEAWEWNVFGGYRYVQPDAVLDAFTDSDFHLGGTNAKGYFLGGNLALYKNTWLTARWLSADEVYGDPLAIDVLQLDLNARF